MDAVLHDRDGGALLPSLRYALTLGAVKGALQGWELTSGMADCDDASTCMSEVSTERWEATYESIRANLQTNGPSYLVKNLQHGYLPYITRECSPANNATGGQGQVVNSMGLFPNLTSASIAPFKVDAPFCGSTNAGFPWASARADGNDVPFFDMCTLAITVAPARPCVMISYVRCLRTTGNTALKTAYTPDGVCGRWSQRELVLGATLYTDPSAGGVATASRIGLFGVKRGLNGPSPAYDLVHMSLDIAMECIGGWINGAIFVCHHCPGHCNSDLPGGYEWQTTPSYYDGSLVYDQMFHEAPFDFASGTELLAAGSIYTHTEGRRDKRRE